MGAEGAGGVIGPNHEGDHTFKSFNEILVAFEGRQAYPVCAGGSSAGPAKSGSDIQPERTFQPPQHALSPREKRRFILQIVNPEPDQDGNLRLEISLYHADRHIKRGLAIRVNGQNEQDANGEYLFFIRGAKVTAGGKVDLPALLGRIAQSAQMPCRIRTQAEREADQRAINLWPVIPRHSGRPLGDFLALCERNAKALKHSASASSVRP